MDCRAVRRSCHAFIGTRVSAVQVGRAPTTWGRNRDDFGLFIVIQGYLGLLSLISLGGPLENL